MDLSRWNDVGRAIVDWLNPIVGLANLHAAISWLAALTAIWSMQRLTRDAGFRSRRVILLSVLRLMLGLMALAFALAGLTPFITSEPPWLADLPIVITMIAVLILITAISGEPKKYVTLETHKVIKQAIDERDERLEASVDRLSAAIDRLNETRRSTG
jgi:hypothetical protein